MNRLNFITILIIRIGVILSLLGFISSVASALEPVHIIKPIDAGSILDANSLSSEDFQYNLGEQRYTGLRTLFLLPQDPFFKQQWYFHNRGQKDSKGEIGLVEADIKILPALEVFQPRSEIVIAVIDSGLDLNHEDISPDSLWINKGELGIDQNGNRKESNGIDDDGNGYIDDLNGWNFVKDIHDVQDRHYHGTHVGALLAAVANNNIGMSGGFNYVKLMLLKIFDLGGTAKRQQIAKAITYACNNGAKIINASWGSRYKSEEIKSAISACHEKGVLFVGAAGNSRRNMNIEPDYPSAYDFENQIIVSATDNKDRPATFSNYGSMVDIAAPGNAILSLLPKNKYRAFSGTSQATPLVAGAAALLWAQQPELNHLQVKQRLLSTADQRIALKRWVSSAARLNIYNLLTNQQGEKLKDLVNPNWHTKPYLLESLHPYAYNTDKIYEISIPGASYIKVFFERFQLDKYSDTLTMTSKNGQIIEHLNTNLGSFWSEAIPGDKVLMRLKTNDKVNDWGFKITKVQYQ